MMPCELAAPFERAGWTVAEGGVLLHGRTSVGVKPSRNPSARPGEFQVSVGSDAGAYTLACGPEHVLAVCHVLAANGEALGGSDLTTVLAECAAHGAKVSEQGKWKPLFQPAPDAPAGQPVQAGEEPWRDVFAAHGWYSQLDGARVINTSKVRWLLQLIDREGTGWRVTFDCKVGTGGRGYRVSGPDGVLAGGMALLADAADYAHDRAVSARAGDPVDVEFIAMARSGLTVEKRDTDWFTAVSEGEDNHPWLPLPMDNDVATLLLGERDRTGQLLAALRVDGRRYTWNRADDLVRAILPAERPTGRPEWTVTEGLRAWLRDEAGRPAELVALGEAAWPLATVALHDLVESPGLVAELSKRAFASSSWTARPWASSKSWAWGRRTRARTTNPSASSPGPHSLGWVTGLEPATSRTTT